jgi:serine/threonine-protein kinase HipA
MAERLFVRRDGEVLATLTRSGPKLWAAYSEAVLDTIPAGTPLLSCSLPVRSTRVDATAWARGMLPEGQHRRALAETADVAASDTFGLLARYGRDIAGAFEIIEDVDAPPREPDLVPYRPEELEAEVAGLDTMPLAIHEDSELSLAGLQDKMVVVRTEDAWARPVHGYPSTHILKVDPHQHPGLVDAEAACLRVARAVGLTDISVERCRLADRETLIVSRFDREERSGRPPRRIHQEDLLQALGVYPDGNHGRAKYQEPRTPGPPSWWHAAELLDAYADDVEAEHRRLLRAVTFTTVIANADCHAKNVAFLLEAGRIRLAPLYDTVPTALWPKLRATSALSVAGVSTTADVGVAELVTEAQRWRMQRDVALETVIDVLEDLEARAGVSDHDQVAELVAGNARRLLDGAATR